MCSWKTRHQYQGTYLDFQNSTRKIFHLYVQFKNQNKVTNRNSLSRNEKRAVDAKDAVNQREEQYGGYRHLVNLPSVEIEDHIIE